MSEKIYALLLRLYPARFRREYGGEAMQLFRDRLRHETGFLLRVRLWAEMLFDVATSAPREYERAAAPPAPAAYGLPSFLVLEEQPLRPRTFLVGTALSLVAVGTFVFLMTHGGNGFAFPDRARVPLRRAVDSAAVPDGGTARAQPDSAAEDAAAPIFVPDAAERQRVIAAVTNAVRADDRDASEAQAVAEMLREQQSSGAYDDARSGSAFALLLTGQLASVTRHTTVTVLCGTQPSPDNDLWTTHPGAQGTAWLRIDEHFSVTVAAVRDRPPAGANPRP
jgi:hypothetical protein